MRRVALVPALASILFALACACTAPSGGKPAEAPAAEKPAEAPAAEKPAAEEPPAPPAGDDAVEPMEGKVIVTLAPATCKSDDECVVSCAKTDSCCEQLCQCSNVYHRDQLAALETAKKAKCPAVPACPVARCRPPEHENVGRCKEGTCVLESVPLAE